MTIILECDMCGKQIETIILNDYEQLQFKNPRTELGYKYDLCPQCAKQIRSYIGQNQPNEITKCQK